MTEVVYQYQLVEFIDEKNEAGKKLIDCVPTNWVTFDTVVGQCYTKFMPPPYTIERNKQLKKMIINGDDPPYEWSQFCVRIRGGAGKCNIFLYFHI